VTIGRRRFSPDCGVAIRSEVPVEEVLIALGRRVFSLLLDIGGRPQVPAGQRIAFKTSNIDRTVGHARSPHVEGLPPGRRTVTAGEPPLAQSSGLRGLAAVPCPLNGGWREAVIDAPPAWQKSNAT
jgi:hypothetical protein